MALKGFIICEDTFRKFRDRLKKSIGFGIIKKLIIAHIVIYLKRRGNLMFYTIELFAGAGGLALGIEKAGFETLGLIELDKNAADTLKKNRPGWNVINDDIANISCLDLEKYFHYKEGRIRFAFRGCPLSSIFLCREKTWFGRCQRNTFLSLRAVFTEITAKNVFV